MNTFFQKAKIPAIIALILTFILFIIIIVSLIGNIITILNISESMRFNTIYNFIISLIKTVLNFAIVVIFNLLVLTKQKRKNLIYISICFTLVITFLQAFGNISSFISNIIFLINYSTDSFPNVVRSLITLLISISIFLITLLQFSYFLKHKDETAN